MAAGKERYKKLIHDVVLSDDDLRDLLLDGGDILGKLANQDGI
jgi:hypothetical protein